ncbi:Predicted ATPase [Anaerovirgula multivorans]|uniref:Predicted ATPase n=1 Tax=Anaerovirgula multivorans TaxID=312168 RepID=A0A239I800_9FIRM|nr:tetratricopeptide repeat protein [Anaerovirgula multivorans]SNS89611.1 Predicted ATPase [Anaerovirgula multivorans]
MTIITAKLLGNPMIYKNNKQITFPYKKAEALFYYLLIEKRVSRDILVNLFWGTVTEEVAKKNLRNAVYMVKKAFDEDVLLSPQRSMIILNPDISFQIDTEKFIQSKEKIPLKNYVGDFLEGFFVKDAEGFEGWMLDLRDKYKDVYVYKLHHEVEISYENNEYKKAEKHCKTLINIDEFDEKAYRQLMIIYQAQGKYNQGIDIYNRLVEILKKELAITPDMKTIKLAEELIKEKSQKETTDKKQYKDFFYGRKKELQLLEKDYQNFINDQGCKSFFVIGEAGIGKSKLLEVFLKAHDINEDQIFFTYCYQAEENYLLKPWNIIFSKLSNVIEKNDIEIPILQKNIASYMFPAFSNHNNVSTINSVENLDFLKYQVMENNMIDILERMAKYKKNILIFEDLQWADSMSITLLKNLILHNRNNSIMIFGTCRNEYRKKLDDFSTELGAHDLIYKLELRRFNKDEMIDFSIQLMPNYPFNQQIRELIYRETEGNPFFLKELLNNIQENRKGIQITAKMEDIIRARFLNVSEEGKKILNIISVFFDGAPFKYLQEISDKSDMELMDIIEELQDRDILKEMMGIEDVELIFTHQKLREYLYMQLSLSRKKVLHERIGSLIEGKLKKVKSDMLLYSKLIYHFSNAGNWIAALKYSIKNLEEYLYFNHEIFPVINSEGNSAEAYLYLTQDQAKTKIKEIEALLQKVKGENHGNSELRKLEMAYLHMEGRLCIRQGNYDKGMHIIREIIDKSLEEKEYTLALKGYRQMIYYCINTQNIVLMVELIEKALEIAEKQEDKEEIGILYRLKGLLKIIEGEYEEGEEILKNAILIFNTLPQPEKYLLNIAAAYNYIGESKRHNQKFQEAIDYYKKAIAICQEKKILRGLAIFQTNTGLAFHAMGEDEKAKSYFNKALKIYKKLDSLWGRSIAFGHLSLILIKEGKYQEALQYLLKAEGDAQKLKSPYETALVLRVKAEISKQMKRDEVLNKVFFLYINKGVEVYCREGIDILKELKGYYEINLFKQLIES